MDSDRGESCQRHRKANQSANSRQVGGDPRSSFGGIEIGNRLKNSEDSLSSHKNNVRSVSSHKNSVHNVSCHRTEPVQNGLLKCFYTNTDFVIKKRSELFSVKAREGADIVCIKETLPENHSSRTEPVELQLHLHGYDCFHTIMTMGQDQCPWGVAMWVKNSFWSSTCEAG